MNIESLKNKLWRRYHRLTGRRYSAGRAMRIPRTLEYRGEFGLELLVFLPFVAWLSSAGLLRNRTIKTYRGMKSFYEGLEFKTFVEHDRQREFIAPGDRPAYLPVKSEHDFDGVGRSPFHIYPDFRGMFRSLPLPSAFEARLAERPLVIVHNKHTDEWNSGPVNHISLPTLERLFSDLSQAFTVVYIRHGIRRIGHGYVGDENTMVDFDDAGLLARFPDIVLFDDLFETHRSETGADDINAFKNALCSRSFRFITSQGGGAHHLAYFSGSVMIILHRRGKEEEMAYADGFYNYLANPAPIRLCCRTEEDLVEASSVMRGSEVVDGRIFLTTQAAAITARHSPWTFGPPRKTAS